jgi:hypothetical protein
MIHYSISDVEQCWLHGFKSFHQDIDETANPYTRGTTQAHYWREGWWEAFFNTDDLSDAYEQHYQQLDVDSLAS